MSSSVSSYEDAYVALHDAMDELREYVGAASVLLADSAGELILEAGESPGGDAAAAAAQCVGQFKAGRELARLVGAPDAAPAYHGGPRGGHYTSRLGKGLLLSVVLGPGTAPGLSWLGVSGAVERIGKLVDDLLDRVMLSRAGAESPRDLFARDAAARIDGLFGGD